MMSMFALGSIPNNVGALEPQSFLPDGPIDASGNVISSMREHVDLLGELRAPWRYFLQVAI